MCPCVSRALLKTSWRRTERWLKKSPADTPDRSYRESTICTATWSYTETSKVNRSSHKSPPAKNSGLLLCNGNLKESVACTTPPEIHSFLLGEITLVWHRFVVLPLGFAKNSTGERFCIPPGFRDKLGPKLTACLLVILKILKSYLPTRKCQQCFYKTWRFFNHTVYKERHKDT